MDNPQYPWSYAGQNTQQEFINAWRYLVEFFRNQKVKNVYWVWNPWLAKNIDIYYPGNDYVDVIGLTILNYGLAYDIDNKYWQTFDTLYLPFREKIQKYNKPIIISKLGSTPYGGDNRAWIMNSLNSIINNYQEINAVVFFHTDKDANWPYKKKSPFINWSLFN